MIEALQQVLDSDYILTDEASRVLYAQDVYTKDIPALAVACPGNVDELSNVVAAVTAAGHAVITNCRMS